MKVAVKKVDALGRELTFDVPHERVTKKLDQVYKAIGKNAVVKGFRKGKAPRNVLEKVHGNLAREEMLKGLIPEIYHEGLEQEKLAPIDLPEISNVDLKDSGLTFTATLDLRPEITIKEYKGLKVKHGEKDVTDEDVNKMIEMFKQTPGQEKDEKKKDDKKKDVEIDDEFAKKMGFKTVDEFKEALKKQLAFDKERQARMQEEEQLIEKLLKNTKMDVPKSLVKRQVYARMEQMAKMMSQQGLGEEEMKKKMEESKKDLEKSAEKDVKVFLTLQEIAKLENIQAEKEQELIPKVLDFLFKEAQWEAKK